MLFADFLDQLIGTMCFGFVIVIFALVMLIKAAAKSGVAREVGKGFLQQLFESWFRK